MTAYSLCIHWKSNNNILRYKLEYEIISNNRHIENSSKVIVFDSTRINTKTKQTNPLVTAANHTTTEFEYFNVIDLEPKTQYKFTIQLYYTKLSSPYVWPPDSRFTFVTLGDCPTAPGKPIIRHVSGNVYKVSWDPAKDNGAHIDEYSLEALHTHLTNHIVRRSATDYDSINEKLSMNEKPTTTTTTTTPIIQNNSLIEIDKLAETLNYTTMLSSIPLSVEEEDIPVEKWMVYYNGTDTYWIIENLRPITEYAFRVRAKNEYGWGQYSTTSEPISEPYVSAESPGYLIYIFVPVLGVLVIIIFICLIIGKYDQLIFFAICLLFFFLWFLFL